jgi:hypothetical protein
MEIRGLPQTIIRLTEINVLLYYGLVHIGWREDTGIILSIPVQMEILGHPQTIILLAERCVWLLRGMGRNQILYK